MTLYYLGFSDKQVILCNMPIKIPVLFIWDNQDFLKNEVLSKFIDFEVTHIHSKDSIKSLDINNYKAIILLLENNIENAKRTDFYGLEIIEFLRKDKKFRRGIGVYSWISKDSFKKSDAQNNENRFGILFSPSLRLLQLSTIIDNMESEIGRIIDLPELSKSSIEDIIYTFYRQKGKVREIFHQLRTDIPNSIDESDIENSLKSTLDQARFKVKKIVKEYNDEIDIHFNDLNAKCLKSYIEASNIGIVHNSNVDSFIVSCSDSIVNNYLPLELDGEEANTKSLNWDILYIEDDIDTANKVKIYFETIHPGNKCHLAKNYEEALSLLNKDSVDRIKVLVSDIRLKNEDGDFEDRQGYDVISELTKNRNSYVKVILSAKRGSIMRLIRQNSPPDVSWFLKEEVLKSQESFNVFFNHITLLAEDKISTDYKFKPDFVYKKDNSFTFSYLEMYDYHKNSKDYDKIEIDTNNWVLEKIYLEEITNSKFKAKLSGNELEGKLINKFRENILKGRKFVIYILAKEFFDGLSNSIKINDRLLTERLDKILFDSIKLEKDRTESIDHNKDDNGRNLINTTLKLNRGNGLYKALYYYKLKNYQTETNLPFTKEECEFVYHELIQEATQDMLGIDGRIEYKDQLKEIFNKIETYEESYYSNNKKIISKRKHIQFLLNIPDDDDFSPSPRPERLIDFFKLLVDIDINFRSLISDLEKLKVSNIPSINEITTILKSKKV